MGRVKLRTEGNELMSKTREEAFKANFVRDLPGDGMHLTYANI